MFTLQKLLRNLERNTELNTVEVPVEHYIIWCHNIKSFTLVAQKVNTNQISQNKNERLGTTPWLGVKERTENSFPGLSASNMAIRGYPKHEGVEYRDTQNTDVFLFLLATGTSDVSYIFCFLQG